MRKSENMLAFEAAMKESKELRDKYVAAQKRIIENKEAGSDGEMLVKAAAEVGFVLTMEELERAIAQAQELSDEELVAVSGGAGNSDDYVCTLDYYCYIAFKHDEDGNTNRACFSDYYCVFIYVIHPDYASYG